MPPSKPNSDSERLSKTEKNTLTPEEEVKVHSNDAGDWRPGELPYPTD